MLHEDKQASTKKRKIIVTSHEKKQEISDKIKLAFASKTPEEKRAMVNKRLKTNSEKSLEQKKEISDRIKLTLSLKSPEQKRAMSDKRLKTKSEKPPEQKRAIVDKRLKTESEKSPEQKKVISDRIKLTLSLKSPEQKRAMSDKRLKTKSEKATTTLKTKSEKSLEQKKEISNKIKLALALKSPEQKRAMVNKRLKTESETSPEQKQEIKEKIINTMIKKYGAAYHGQGYKMKNYTLPSGKVLKIQGYEHFALDAILKSIPEEKVHVGVKNVPEIKYVESMKTRRHYVDIFLPFENKMIEVKSKYTLDHHRENVFAKQAAAKTEGYSYEIWVYSRTGTRLELYC